MQKSLLKKMYLNKKVHIISMHNNIDVWGIVTGVDNQGYIHGTWGDYVPDLPNDYVSFED